MMNASRYPTSSTTTTLPDYDNGSQLENAQDYVIPNDLFIISDALGMSDNLIQDNVTNPILHNLYDKTKAPFIRFHVNKRVNNQILLDNFERCRKKLSSGGSNPQEVFGFIQLPNGDHGEEDELCYYGVRVGMSYRGELADASKGVYLSKHPDCCSPSAFLNDQNLRILICKVLLGKSRRVLPSTNQSSWTLSPDVNYNSYVALTTDNVNSITASPLVRYKNSLMYVYEYENGTNTAERPSSILPLSVVEIQCNKPGSDFLNILVPKNNNSVVWTGTLLLQKYLLKHVTMHSHFPMIGKPRGLDNLQFKVAVPYDTVSNCLPIKRLLQEDMIGVLMRKSELVIDDQMTPMYVQYFTLKCDECEEFDNICTLMRKFELVAVNKLPTGTYLFLVPNGGLSLKMGLCLFNTASFHLISISTRSSSTANVNWQSDPFDRKMATPPPNAMINMKGLAARFKNIHPSTPTNLVTPPPNFNIPPPNFNIPPPNIQQPQIQTVLPMFSGSNNVQSPVSSEPKPITAKVQPMTSSFFPRDPVKFMPSGDSTTKPRLDPRLASQNSRDPRLLSKIEPQQTKNADVKNEVGNRKEPEREMSKFKLPDNIPQDVRSIMDKRLSNSSPKLLNFNIKSNKRSSSSDEEEGSLQIDEGDSPPKSDFRSNRKRSSNSDTADIDMRQQIPSYSNGQQSSSMFSRLSSNQTSNQNRAKASRFGPQAQNLKPPSLIDPSKINFAPPLGPPKIEPNQNEGFPTSSSGLKKIVIVPDPDLFFSLALQVDQLQELFSTVSQINRESDQTSITFKWHLCINNELQKQAKELTAQSNRARRFLESKNSYVELIDPLAQHLCDTGIRSAQKYLICCVNIKRSNKDDRMIFLSTNVTTQSLLATNFVNEKIELYTPDELIKYFKNNQF